MMGVLDTCSMLAVLVALSPSLAGLKLGGSRVGWGPAFAALFVGGILTSPIIVPLLGISAMCDLVGYTYPLRKEAKSSNKKC